MDIVAWLQGLGLGQYEGAFRDNDIDADLLPSLTGDDLRDLGVASVGHRRRLLAAIAALTAGGQPSPAVPVALAAARDAERSDEPSPSRAERRQLTVMFVDLVGSTELSRALDPEDMAALIRAYQNVVAGEITRFEGHVAKFLGDGVLAYFGWPHAHEDAAERAARAGLGVARAAAGLETPTGEPLAARVGIATGPVVVGELVGSEEARERAVVGETPNLAARLQGLAEPGGVVVADGTRRLLGGLFAYRDLETAFLKGFAEPVRAWSIVGEGAAEGRFEAMHGAVGLTPLVGREHELAMLLERWERAKDGEGQVVLLAGEPGIGKSRLVRALRERLEAEPHTPLSHFCSPYHANTALYPVIGLLERAAGLRREDPPERRLDRLETMLALATNEVNQSAPLLADLLAIPTEGRYPPLDLSPQQKKQRTFQVLLDQLAGLATARPALALYEDVHWADPTTLELLGQAVERVQRLPALAVVTFRPEFAPPWTGHGHVTALSLSRLGRRQGGAMVEGVAGGKALPPEVLERILARTDGVPLFVEELTKVVLESGLLAVRGNRYELEGPLPPLAIPATLQDSLMARLDRLAPVKEVAQTGAVIGREFSFELLAALVNLGEEELVDALAKLAAADLLFQRGTPPDATYIFKHALVQDAAYGSLLRSRRQVLHAKIAEALEERFQEATCAQPELVAHHWASAGMPDRAVAHWATAGQQALARSATTEAIAHFRAALSDLGKLPESPERDRRELAIQRAAGSALVAAHGFAAPETGRAYERALELTERIGDLGELFPVLYGLCLYHLYGADLGAARAAAQRLLGLAEESDDAGFRFFAHRAAGVSAYPAGDFAVARGHLQQALALYDPAEHRAPAFVYAFDPRVVCLDYLARTLLPLGEVDAALRHSREALAEARRLGHRNSLCLPLFFGATLRQQVGDREATLEMQAELALIAEEERFPIWAAGAKVLQGWAAVDAGDAVAGAALIEEGVRDWQATGARLMLPYFEALLADATRRAGRPGEAAAQLRGALKRAEATGERWFAAELHRRLGQTHAAQGDPAKARAEAAAALELARGQGARLWELRAALDLAALLADQGDGEEAAARLEPLLADLDGCRGLPEFAAAARLLARLGAAPALLATS